MTVRPEISNFDTTLKVGLELSAVLSLSVAQEILQSEKRYTQIVALANGIFLASVLSAQLDIPVQTLRVEIEEGYEENPVIRTFDSGGSNGKDRLITADILGHPDQILIARHVLKEADLAVILALDSARDQAAYAGKVLDADIDKAYMWYEATAG